MLVILVGFELGKSSIEKIFAPVPVVFSIISMVILGVSAIVKLALFIFNTKVSKAINSDALKATAIDCRNDAIITTAVIIAMVIEKLTTFPIDGYMGTLIAIFVAYSGIKLTIETISPILGKKDDGELKNKIIEKIKEYPIVIAYHDLMIHDYGPGVSFCSIHFEIDKNLDPLYVHELIDKFEREFLSIGVNLTVHYDPVVTDSPELNLIKHTVTTELVNFDNRLSIHDFRSIPCDGFTKVFFDLPLPEDLKDQKQNITSRINNVLNGINDVKYSAEITFDSEAFN
jgi:cation diffusion facilitator family transporter